MNKYQIKIKLTPETKTFSMNIFDFDDTLVAADHHPIYVTNELTGLTRSLTKNEFLTYSKTPGEVCDFSSFDIIKSEHKIEPVWMLFLESLDKSKNATQTEHTHLTIVLSARSKIEPIVSFLHEVEKVVPCHIVGISIEAGENNGIHKSGWIRDLMAELESNNLEVPEINFYDDRDDNIIEVSVLHKEFPKTVFKIHKVDEGKIIPFSF